MSAESELDSLFEKAFNIHKDLTNTSLLTNSTEYQKNVEEAIKLLETATNEINTLQLFSLNEAIDDIHNTNLKYLLIPALLGSLTLRLTSGKRTDILEVANAYFRDFLARLKIYGVTDLEFEDLDPSEDKVVKKTREMSLEDMAVQRNAKIAKYKKDKEMNEKIERLNRQIEENRISVDDEIVREYYLTLLQLWVSAADDELKAIKSELDILKHMKDLPVKSPRAVSALPANKPTFKPIILTRNKLQKEVYGLGYPSVPTMTINEFVNQKLDEGSLSVTNPVYQNSLQQWAADPERKLEEDEQDAAHKEKLAEKEDEEAIQKARSWDDWKDDHKRGWGNRQNMG